MPARHQGMANDHQFLSLGPRQSVEYHHETAWVEDLPWSATCEPAEPPHLRSSTLLHLKWNSRQSNQGFICDWTWVKSLCKSIITTKEALLRFTVVLFLGKLIFNGVQGHFYTSIKIAFVKTLRRLDTTWNFACSITRVSTHEHDHWEYCVCRVY